MKIIKTLFIAVITAGTFTAAQAQIHLPPPPPRPSLPKIHLKTPPPPPRPGEKIVLNGPGKKSSVTVKRHYYYRKGVRHYRTY